MLGAGCYSLFVIRWTLFVIRWTLDVGVWAPAITQQAVPASLHPANDAPPIPMNAQRPKTQHVPSNNQPLAGLRGAGCGATGRRGRPIAYIAASALNAPVLVIPARL
jgi:hypothetical protein